MSSCLRIVTVVLALLFAGSRPRRRAPAGSAPIPGTSPRPSPTSSAGMSPHGAKVANTPAPGSPAEKAGLRNGDIILSIDRTVIDNSADVDAYLAGKQPGTELRLQVSERRARAACRRDAWPRGRSAGGSRRSTTTTCPTSCSTRAGTWRSSRASPSRPTARQLVTASEDKQVRVWDWKSGQDAAHHSRQRRACHRRPDLRHGTVAERALAGHGRLDESRRAIPAT